MKSFLDCYIWSLFADNRTNNKFYLIENIYFYNSNIEQFNRYINPHCIQVPQFEIKNIELLDGIDFNVLYEHNIPIIQKLVVEQSETWSVNLKYYDKIINMQSQINN